MKFEVVELKTGAKMSHTRAGEMMGTTLFDSSDQAKTWCKDNNIVIRTVPAFESGATHVIREVS